MPVESAAEPTRSTNITVTWRRSAGDWVFVIAPHLPKPCATGRPREWPMREIINGIFYVMRAGCPWRLLPSDLPPRGTIYRWFAKFRDEGCFEKINHARTRPVMFIQRAIDRNELLMSHST